MLIDPPKTIREASKLNPRLGLENVDEFSYEPFFPVAILASRAKAKGLEQHRLRQDYGDEVTLLVTPDEEPISHDGFE